MKEYDRGLALLRNPELLVGCEKVSRSDMVKTIVDDMVSSRTLTVDDYLYLNPTTIDNAAQVRDYLRDVSRSCEATVPEQTDMVCGERAYIGLCDKKILQILNADLIQSLTLIGYKPHQVDPVALVKGRRCVVYEIEFRGSIDREVSGHLDGKAILKPDLVKAGEYVDVIADHRGYSLYVVKHGREDIIEDLQAVVLRTVTVKGYGTLPWDDFALLPASGDIEVDVIGVPIGYDKLCKVPVDFKVAGGCVLESRLETVQLTTGQKYDDVYDFIEKYTGQKMPKGDRHPEIAEETHEKFKGYFIPGYSWLTTVKGTTPTADTKIIDLTILTEKEKETLPSYGTWDRYTRISDGFDYIAEEWYNQSGTSYTAILKARVGVDVKRMFASNKDLAIKAVKQFIRNESKILDWTTNYKITRITLGDRRVTVYTDITI